MNLGTLLVLTLAIAAVVVACSNDDGGVTGWRGDEMVIDGTGSVELFFPSGNCASIDVEGGDTLEPMNLPIGFQKQGLRIRFRAKVLRHAISTCQVGRIVEILEIEPL